VVLLGVRLNWSFKEIFGGTIMWGSFGFDFACEKEWRYL
jgi:hypothetical protein